MINISGNATGNWNDAGEIDTVHPLFVNSAGRQKFLTRHYHVNRPLGRVDWQMILIVSGCGWFDFGEGERRIPAGHLVLYSPGQPQHYHYRREDNTELYWMHFTGSEAARHVREAGLGQGNDFVPEDIDRCVHCFMTATAEVRDRQPHYIRLAASALTDILYLTGRGTRHATTRTASTRSPVAGQDAIMKAAAYLRENHQNPGSVAALAQLCNLSLYRFIHRFKEETGLTPLTFLTGIRMEEARRLLTDTRMPIADIAAVVGYEDPLYFSRMFRKTVGQPPSRYRATKL